jgi:hypothetical protein
MYIQLTLCQGCGKPAQQSVGLCVFCGLELNEKVNVVVTKPAKESDGRVVVMAKRFSRRDMAREKGGLLIAK